MTQWQTANSSGFTSANDTSWQAANNTIFASASIPTWDSLDFIWDSQQIDWDATVPTTASWFDDNAATWYD